MNPNIGTIFTKVYLMLLMMLAIGGCAKEEIIIDPPSGEVVPITLDISAPISTALSTASGSDYEQTIDMDNLKVLVFEETPSGEIFRYKANISRKTDFSVTVLAKKSVNNEKFRFVVLANTTNTVSMNDGESKSEILNRFTFDCAGEWNAIGSSAKLIPMWGEYSNTFAIKRETHISVLMHRALARVDIGLKFINDSEGNPTESVEGLENFKIKSVRVYRTKNKAYVATSADKMNNSNEVITPNIPTDAIYNLGDGTSSNNIEDSDNSPLLYALSVPSDKCIREIYIPESFQVGNDPSMDEVPCMVIGGYYGKDNTTTETFYRVDFARYNGPTPVEYKTILRNYRYVVNISNVTREGFPDPEKALHSIPVGMELTVDDWYEHAFNFHVQGNYFFGLERREVWFDASLAVIVDEDGEEMHVPSNITIPFRTNIDIIKSPNYLPDLPQYENVTCKWESSGTQETPFFYGDLYLDGFVNKQGNMVMYPNNIGISALSGNIGKEARHDRLIITIKDCFEIIIDVYQRAASLDYTIICNETVVHGRYREDIPLNYTNYLEVRLVPILSGDMTINNFMKVPIAIYSEKRKGILFEFRKTLEQGLLDGSVFRNTDNSFIIKLQGQGTPVKDINDPINPDNPDGILTRIDNLKILSNSYSNNLCSNTSIIFGYKTKRILAIGANAGYRYGYQLEPNSGSRAFIDASINFGVDPNSTVTMEQFPDDYVDYGNYASARGNAFHVEYMTSGRGMSGERINFAYLQTMLNEFKPDIIITGQAILFQEEDMEAIADFVNKRGVLLMFNEYYPSASSINQMVGRIVGTTLTGSNQTLSRDQFVFTIPSDGNANDSILVNSFGDLRGKKWGTDGYYLHGFSGLPLSDIVVYNTRPGIGDPCFFRYTKKPFVFIGDGGFISNAQRYIGPTYQGMDDYCPFAINSAYQPIARTNFLNGAYGPVDNSKLFGNILTWAVDYAELHGINSKQNN